MTSKDALMLSGCASNLQGNVEELASMVDDSDDGIGYLIDAIMSDAKDIEQIADRASE